MAERIETPSKSQLKRWGKLTLEKYRRQEGRFLAEGVKVVGELLRSGRPLESLLVSREKAGRWGEILAKVPADIGIYGLSNHEWAALSQDAAPEGMMAVAVTPHPPEPEFLSKAGGPLLLLYRVNNPNNLGALLRTADWFGFRTVILSSGSAEATNPKVIRTSMGSFFHLMVVEDADFEKLLPELQRCFQIVGSQVREGIFPHPCPAGTALLMGSESHGLPASLLALTDEQWRIPGRGETDSLSLPQAAAVMMYECTRKIDKGK